MSVSMGIRLVMFVCLDELPVSSYNPHDITPASPDSPPFANQISKDMPQTAKSTPNPIILKPCNASLRTNPMPTTIAKLPSVVIFEFEFQLVDAFLDASQAPWTPQSLLLAVPCEDAEEALG